jgi:hypothetical protein
MLLYPFIFIISIRTNPGYVKVLRKTFQFLTEAMFIIVDMLKTFESSDSSVGIALGYGLEF